VAEAAEALDREREAPARRKPQMPTSTNTPIRPRIVSFRMVWPPGFCTASIRSSMPFGATSVPALPPASAREAMTRVPASGRASPRRRRQSDLLRGDGAGVSDIGAT